jgi:peptidoglycan pentaglycine glycine transferase (the first glycine)
MMQPFKGSASEWNSLISRLPAPHLLQTWEWAQVKARVGWQSMPFTWDGAAALVLKKVLPVAGFARRMCVLYLPKGPLMDWGNSALLTPVLNDLQTLARKQGAIFIKADPDVLIGSGIPGAEDSDENSEGQALQSELSSRGWQFSQDQIQFRNTVLVDLTASAEELLARMKQKTRYNLRLAEKKGVTVRTGGLDDLPLLYKMYAETSLRDGFVIRDEAYYRAVWETFMRNPSGDPLLPSATPLVSEVNGEPVAAIFLFSFAGRAYYIYGMSRATHREKMPNHLLQWEAMRRAKALGCHTYDLWGAPEVFDESDSMWGVFRFKEGLGGNVVRTLGAWDYAPSPMLYKLYTRTLPRILDIMRSRGNARTRTSLEG